MSILSAPQSFLRLFALLTVVGAASVVIPAVCDAAAPTCVRGQTASQTYCQYQGRMRQLYVCDDGAIFLYDDVAMAASEIEDAEIDGVRDRAAAVVRYADNPVFA